MQLDHVGGTGDPLLPRTAPTTLHPQVPVVAARVAGISAAGWPVALADRVSAALQMASRGETATAGALLRGLWDGEPGVHLRGPLGRCLLAHHLAAVADDTAAELHWHRRALQAGQLASDAECADWGLPIPVRALFPLLHLRLGECHATRSELTQALVHLREGWVWAPALPADRYGTRVRAGLDLLGERLDLALPPRGRHRGPQPPQGLGGPGRAGAAGDRTSASD